MENKNGVSYIGQITQSFSITLDEVNTPFLLLVSPDATDTDTIGVLTITGKAETLPVWAAKKYPHVITAVTTAGSTAGIQTNLRGGQ